jgi:hypothetical protein
VSLEWVFLQTLSEGKQTALKEPEEVTKDDVQNLRNARRQSMPARKN